MTRMTAPPDAIAQTLIADFQTQTPLRVWSLIVTFFGDAILPRGGTVALSTISDLLAEMDIGGSAVRPALSRLARDGLVERDKVGRRSFYRLSPKAARDFALASERIYTHRSRDWDGSWRIIILPPDAGNGRESLRATLRAAGLGQVAPNVLIAPHLSADELAGLLKTAGTKHGAPALFSATLENPDTAAALFASAWPETGARRAYQRVLDQFKPLAGALDASDGAVRPETAMILRLLLIHQFRRAALIDPDLPEALIPDDWPGGPARALAGQIYHALIPQSERWLDSHGATANGPLPSPALDLATRFETG